MSQRSSYTLETKSYQLCSGVFQNGSSGLETNFGYRLVMFGTVAFRHHQHQCSVVIRWLPRDRTRSSESKEMKRYQQNQVLLPRSKENPRRNPKLHRLLRTHQATRQPTLVLLANQRLELKLRGKERKRQRILKDQPGRSTSMRCVGQPG